MNHKNDFKAFSINNNANVVSQERYEESQSLKTGFPPDNITVHLLNKVLRQSSTIASVVSNFIATYSGSDVLDDGDIIKLSTQLNEALEQKIATKVPNASLAQKGITQLTEVVGNSNTLSATQKLVSDVNNNANNRLSKSQNGADIPDKNEFVKNLGLSETVELARNAVSVNGGIIKAGLNVQNVLSVGMNPEKNLRISSSENAESQINLFVWGDSNNRKTIFECGDKNGCLFYSHRLSSNNVELFSAGKIIPADYQNFDARYDNIPIGVPMPYPHKYAPVGYLTCNGQTFDKSLYPKLAEAYPNGRLPDLRGEFIRGWDDSRGVDMERACGSWQPASIQDHTHYKVISRQVVEDLVLTGNEAWSTERNSAYTRSLDQNASTGGIVGTTANETRPRNVAFNYIVRAA